MKTSNLLRQAIISVMVIALLVLKGRGQERMLEASYKNQSDSLFRAYLSSGSGYIYNDRADDTIRQATQLLAGFFSNYYKGLDQTGAQSTSEKLLIFVNPAFKLAFVSSLDTQTVIISELRRTFPASRYNQDSIERKYGINSDHPMKFIVENFYNAEDIKKDTEMVMNLAVHLPAEQGYDVIWDDGKKINDLNRFIAVSPRKDKAQRIKFLQQHINIYETYVKGVWNFGPVLNIKSIVFDRGMKTGIIAFYQGHSAFNTLLKRQGQQWQVEKTVAAGWIN